MTTNETRLDTHRPRRSQSFWGDVRVRRHFRSNARAGHETDTPTLVTRNGVVMSQNVCEVQDGRRVEYAQRVGQSHGQAQLDLRDATNAYDVRSAALSAATTRLSAAVGGGRRAYRDANREYRSARKALIITEKNVERLNALVEKSPPAMPAPRPAPRSFEPVRVAPPSNVAYPAIRVSDARRKRVTLAAGHVLCARVERTHFTIARTAHSQITPASLESPAERGVREAEARSAARAAKMDAAA